MNPPSQSPPPSSPAPSLQQYERVTIQPVRATTAPGVPSAVSSTSSSSSTVSTIIESTTTSPTEDPYSTSATSTSATTSTIDSTTTTTTNTSTTTDNTPTQRQLSLAQKNFRIFKDIDLSKKSSIDKYFKFVNGKGLLKPPITYTGVSASDYGFCFKKIREWRKLTQNQQQEVIDGVRNIPQREKNRCKKNLKAMKKTQDRLLVEEILNGDDDDGYDTDDENLRRINGDGILSSRTSDETNRAASVRLSNRAMENRSLAMARERNDTLLEYVGLGSSEETRRRVIDEQDKENESRKKKARKSGDRPEKIGQAADRYATNERHKALKAIGKYSDTVTIRTQHDAEKNNPRHLVVTLILNEVESTSIDGGTIASDSLQRSKPEFLVVTNSKDDCKKVMSTFNSIFTSNRENCKKESFDVTLINGETSNDKKVATAVNEYIQQSKNKRCTVSKRPLSVNTIIQNQMNSDSGVIEMRR